LSVSQWFLPIAWSALREITRAKPYYSGEALHPEGRAEAKLS